MDGLAIDFERDKKRDIQYSFNVFAHEGFFGDFFSGNVQLQCISRIERSKIMISKLSLFIFFFFDGVRTVRWTRKVSLIFVQLVSLKTCLFGFWNGSFNSTQLEIL